MRLGKKECPSCGHTKMTTKKLAVTDKRRCSAPGGSQFSIKDEIMRLISRQDKAAGDGAHVCL